MSSIDEEMERLYAAELNAVAAEDTLWSEMMESERADLVEDRAQFLAAFDKACDEEE